MMDSAVVRSVMIFSGMIGWAALDSTQTSSARSTTPMPTISALVPESHS